MEINIKTGKVFKRTRKALNEGKKIIIQKGGTGSGKTYDIMMLIILFLAPNNPGKIFTIVSESKPHLDIGVIRYAKEILNNSQLIQRVTYNASRSFFEYDNGSVVEFFSADRIDKALGARRHLLYGNEVNSLKYEVWDELARRSEIILADFNPTWQFWLEDQFLKYYDDYIVLTSNHLDNEFLPETERQRISKRAAMDENFHRVHILCEYGTSEGLVFPSLQMIDTFPEAERVMYGLDFGYSNDPSALVRIAVEGENLFIDELIYQTGLTNRELTALMKAAKVDSVTKITADSAEPKSIQELYLSGFNIEGAAKGPDSIMAGIDRLKQYKLHITKSSVNLIKEFRNYTWLKDKEGKAVNKPIDAYNHGIDALRYGTEPLARKPLTKAVRPLPSNRHRT